MLRTWFAICSAVVVLSGGCLTEFPDAKKSSPCEELACGADSSCIEFAGKVSCRCKGNEIECLRPVPEWQALFDAEWNKRDENDCLTRAKSKGTAQEYHNLAFCIDGLTSMWRASGEDQYLDTALQLIQFTVDDAELGSDGFRRWKVAKDPTSGGIPVTESQYFRMVTTLLRVMFESPDVRAKKNYEKRYAELLEFAERHIWDKWETDGLGNLYRSRTHMASHWARIAVELYRITNKAKYLTVFENISYKTMVGWPSNLRQQFYVNPKLPGAYTWAQVWGVLAPTGDEVQGSFLGGTVVSFVELSAAGNNYWTQADVNALSLTLTSAVWPPKLNGEHHARVNGTERVDSPGQLHEWMVLGRHNAALQKRIETDYVGANLKSLGTQALGIAALNAKILIDGKPVH